MSIRSTGLRAVRVAGCLALAVALSACGVTRPARFFVLAPLAAADGGAGIGVAGGGSRAELIGVDLLRIPELVDRPQFVTSLSEHERSFDEYERWAESLAPHLTGVLVENLAALLAPVPVMAVPSREDRTPGVLVRVEILRFDVRHGGEAVLSARWSLWLPEGSRPFFEAGGRWTAPAGDGSPEQRAAAMSLNMLELSRAVADALAHHPTR